MASIKREAKEKGRREALAALDATAKELGYASHEDMVQKLRANKGRRPAAPAARTAPPETDEDDTDTTPPTTAPSRRRETNIERKLARAEEQRRAAHRARAAAEKRAKQLERQREADAAENELRLAAVAAGVQDVDYALTILRRELQDKSADELAKFDEKKYFSETLRKRKPYLYEVQEQPANTSPPVDPSKPNTQAPPATPPKATPAPGEKDARTMSKADFDQRLRKLGYTPPHLGSPG